MSKKTELEWQPIDTAPKDGTVILGAYFNDLDWEYRLVAWTPSNKMYPWAQTDGRNGWTEDRVSHWMPLPEPPK